MAIIVRTLSAPAWLTLIQGCGPPIVPLWRLRPLMQSSPRSTAGYCERSRQEACARRTTPDCGPLIIGWGHCSGQRFNYPGDHWMFARLGAWCHDRRRLVLGIWAALLILGVALMGTVGGAFREEFNLPESESRVGFELLEANFGGQGTNAIGTIVFRAEQGVDDPVVQAAMEALFTAVAEQPHVLGVISPYSQAGADQVSVDRTIAYANVEMPNDIASAESQAISLFISDQTPAIDGLTVERGTF
ncbi:MAG: hypothetical protein IT334_07495, partial [Thermomicrobiales bacterium]|nr:hypothetical protein [Thermomicrobiales bacterium]